MPSLSLALLLSILSTTTIVLAIPTSNKNSNYFTIPSLTSHQPIGSPSGQTNYYHLAFNLTSPTNKTKGPSYCWKSWGDNSWVNSEAYSLYVPTNQWFQCDSSPSALGDGKSPFQFKLFPYFSIGNFSVEVKETLSDGSSLYGWKHITNGTKPFTCQINPTEVQYIQHASGDCSISNGKGPFQLEGSAKEKASWY